jgi:hypothetical protein
LRDLANPAAIGFLLNFEGQIHVVDTLIQTEGKGKD